MSFIKRIISLLVFVTVTVIPSNFYVRACPTPVFDSLTPNLQKIMRLDAEKTKSRFPQNHSNETLEEMAERDLHRYNVCFDGNLCSGKEFMKLTNEDIESLYNLPCVKQLDLKRFDLTDVDINKFLEINKNRTMEFLDLNDCSFDTFDDEKVVTRITNKEYTVGIHPSIWIAWPGVNPDEIFEGR